MTTFDHQPSFSLQSRGIVNWLTGTGLLVLNGALFFTALVVLIPWNLYTDPGDLWVADPLRKWAFVLAFHTIIVGALLLVRSLLDDGATRTTRSDISAGWSAPRTATPIQARSIDPVRYEQATASSAIAEQWAYKWLAETETDISGRASVDSANDATATWRSWTAAPSPDRRDEILIEDDPVWEPQAPTSKPRGHLEAAARVGTPTNDALGDQLDEDLEWQWIEAAASAWLAKRDHDVSADSR